MTHFIVHFPGTIHSIFLLTALLSPHFIVHFLRASFQSDNQDFLSFLNCFFFRLCFFFFCTRNQKDPKKSLSTTKKFKLGHLELD